MTKNGVAHAVSYEDWGGLPSNIKWLEKMVYMACDHPDIESIIGYIGIEHPGRL